MIDLTLFCGNKDDNRIGEPWSDGNFTFATDGKILVRVARRADVGERLDAPAVMGTHVGDAFDKDPGAWHPLPALTVDPAACPCCRGVGKAYTCPECDGEGAVAPSTDFNVYVWQECKTCKGVGQIPKKIWLRMHRSESDIDAECEKCDGAGKVWDDQAVEVGGALFADRYLSWIAALPNAEIGVFGPLDVARFRFDGGDGVVMPRRKAAHDD